MMKNSGKVPKIKGKISPIQYNEKYKWHFFIKPNKTTFLQGNFTYHWQAENYYNIQLNFLLKTDVEKRLHKLQTILE